MVMTVVILFVALVAVFSQVNGATYYVRTDGGTRASTLVPTGQCNGLADVAWNGDTTKSNQNCAFGDIRYLWAAGVYCTGQGPCWEWVGNGGDTFIVDVNPQGWSVGWPDGVSAENLGIAGDPYSSGAPPMKSGTPDKPTRLLGRNWQNCAADSQKTKVYGRFHVSFVFNLGGTSNTQISCFDISDKAQCGNYGYPYFPTCERYVSPLADFADTGIVSNNKYTNGLITDVSVHGFASSGWAGPVGDNVKLIRFKANGNGGAGMNFDNNDGTTGTGTFTMSDFQLIGNGCVELFPLTSTYKYPYTYCTDQNFGGYGDAWGTATVTSNPAWIINLDHGEVAYNTQDGIDGLHVFGVDSAGRHSQLIMNNMLAYSNMGDQLKAGSSAAIRNSIIYDNPCAMGQNNPGFPPRYNEKLSLFGRGAAGVVLTVSPGLPVIFEGNTMFSSSTVAVFVGGDPACTDDTCALIFRNNIQVNFVCGFETGWGVLNNCTGQIANSIYADQPQDQAIFGLKNTIIAYNSLYRDRRGYCPRTDIREGATTICGSPGLVDETWHNYGYGDVTVASASSPVVGKGLYIAGQDPLSANDYLGKPRKNPPTIGALELGSIFGSQPNPTPSPTLTPTKVPTSSPPTSSPTTTPTPPTKAPTPSPTPNPCAGAAAGAGNGLRGDYYSGINFNTLLGSRIDANVDFNYGSGAPSVSGVPVDVFSIKWQGQVLAPYTGSYTFYTSSDDGIRLYVNNQLIVDRWVQQAEAEFSGTITLTKGQQYSIRLEYFENGGSAAIHLRWSHACIAKQAIPQKFLYYKGSGLTARYFNDPDFTTQVATRIDPNINYNFGTGAPAVSGVGIDNFSIVWDGYFVPPCTGTYTFYTKSDDGNRLYLNYQMIINDWNIHYVKEDTSATFSFTANQIYPIALEYYDATGTASVSLSWSSTCLAKQIIPQSQLYPL